MIRKRLLTEVCDDSMFEQLKECRCKNAAFTMEKLYNIGRQYMYRLKCVFDVNGERCDIELRLVGHDFSWHNKEFDSKYIDELILLRGHVIIKRAGIYYTLKLNVVEETRMAKTSKTFNIMDKKRRFIFH